MVVQGPFSVFLFGLFVQPKIKDLTIGFKCESSFMLSSVIIRVKHQ